LELANPAADDVIIATSTSDCKRRARIIPVAHIQPAFSKVALDSRPPSCPIQRPSESAGLKAPSGTPARTPCLPDREAIAMLVRFFRKLPAALAVLSLALVLTGCGINNIPTLEQNAKAKWSEVLNQYKRRSDLVPNLVETVRGFAEQERQVLTQVTEARARATSVQIPADIVNNPEAMKRFQDAQSQLGAALRQLLLVVERYPDIKSGQNFLALQSQLEGTENRIAIARRDYIEAVRAYNTEITTIPGRFWTILYPSAQLMATFDIPAEEQQAPRVNFNPPRT
jgi:LemA protein